MSCSNCGTENRAEAKFCDGCGAALARACPECGSVVRPQAKFCDECGSPLDGSQRAAENRSAGRPAEVPRGTERRLVSVLFADLVGFTTLSEARDSEEVRDLLSRYFDTCRTVIARYGGVVEKFIGDAVMAVWGAPVTMEDDAERAVRAAIDLTEAVTGLGEQVGAPGLRARAGVLTGEATVNLGATGEGMVAGDMVNTASRIQSAAEPGQVYVGETTRRVTEVSIAYEDAGARELKGKAEPVQLWRALRVVAGVAGALKSEGLEAPFVGRDRELRVIKDLFHVSVEERRAHLVSVVGIGGIGKSRLGWEFYKYMDGLADLYRWHRGRCLAYGEGVAYWALAEMVRGRAEIIEGEDPESAKAKLHAAVERYVPDPEERRWVEPRLAHLLGLEDRAARDREDLFAGWRLFFERTAEGRPVVMAFEDCQWADSSLLDFIDYLLEWSRSHPIFIIAMGRPELLERRPGWGTGRSSTSLYLEPLPPEAMQELLEGLVPGLPSDVTDSILSRAEGVPLYAVETVRMLLDRGLLAPDGAAYKLRGPIESLEVPATLHALIAARLDGLTSEERKLVQDASVLGKTFTRGAISALSSLDASTLDTTLASLTRKELLGIQADPRSPERGQYGFLQDLTRRVAYETLSKRDRKACHVAAGAYLEDAWRNEEEEIVEVVAAHYVQAHDLDPDADDAPAIKKKAEEMLARAGERAASLAASREAETYFVQAAALAGDAASRGRLIERAGQMARNAAHFERARTHFQEAIAIFEGEDLASDVAEVSALLGEIYYQEGKLEEGIERMERAYQTLSTQTADEAFARLAAQLGRLYFFKGDADTASERIETALDVAERLRLPEIISEALNTKAIVDQYLRGRNEEAMALMKHALEIALEHDISQSALRAYNNLASIIEMADRFEETLSLIDAAVDLARRVGDRPWEVAMAGGSLTSLNLLGRWDEAIARADELRALNSESEEGFSAFELMIEIGVRVERGEIELARELIEGSQHFEKSEDVQVRAGYFVQTATVLRGESDHRAALAHAHTALEAQGHLGWAHPVVKHAFIEATLAARALGDFDELGALVGAVKAASPGEMTAYLEAQATRAAAALPEAPWEANLKRAAGLFRELNTSFWLAVTLLDQAEQLVAHDRSQDAVPHLDEAASIFERLGAKPWLDRLEQVRSRRPDVLRASARASS